MKTILLLALSLCTGFSAFGLSIEEGFRSPPPAAKPHTWWHWMNGNVTKAGITADLEAMAAAGIGGAQIFDAGLSLPAGPVGFCTEVDRVLSNQDLVNYPTVQPDECPE